MRLAKNQCIKLWITIIIDNTTQNILYIDNIDVIKIKYENTESIIRISRRFKIS